MEWWHWNTGRTSDDDTTYNGIKNKYREKMSQEELKQAKWIDDSGCEYEINSVTNIYGTKYNPNKHDDMTNKTKVANT